MINDRHNKLYEYVNNKQFDDIIKYINSIKNIEERTKLYYFKYYNSFNLAHISIVENNKKLFNFVLNNKPNLFYFGDIKLNTPLHTALRLNRIDFANNILEYEGRLLNMIDYDNMTPLTILCNYNVNYKLLFEYLTKYKNIINYTILCDSKILLFLITRYDNSNKNNKNYILKLIDYLLDYDEIKIDYPNNEPPLLPSMDQDDHKIFDIIIKKRPESIYINNIQKLSPITVAVNINNIYAINQMLKIDSKIFDHGYTYLDNILKISLSKKHYEILDIILDNSNLINKPVNGNLNTIAHTILYDYMINFENYPYELLVKCVMYSDLNIQNSTGLTPFHLLIKGDQWKILIKILEMKKLDIFSKNKFNSSPLSYVKKYDIKLFSNLIVNSYINQLKYMSSNKIQYLHLFDKECYDNINKCKKSLFKDILKREKSYPIIDNNDKICDDIDFINPPYVNKSGFHPQFSVLYILTIIFLEKYKELFIPYTKVNDISKNINDKSELLSYYIVNNIPFISITHKCCTMSDTNYNLIQIVWSSENEYYNLNKNTEYGFRKCLYNDNIRFIYIPLTLVYNTTGEPAFHSNLILYDKQKKILEIYDPQGYNNYEVQQKSDNTIKEYFFNILKKDININEIEFISPTSCLEPIGFQTVSNELNIINQKIGDTCGFCAAWTFWYLEMRLINPDVHPYELLKKAKSKIIERRINFRNKIEYEETERSVFIDYIRDYSDMLDKLRIRRTLQMGFSEDHVYNVFKDTPEHHYKLKENIKLLIEDIENR